MFQSEVFSPILIRPSGSRIKTRSYGIQCLAKDTKYMLRLLKFDSFFVPFKLRHQKPQQYQEAFEQQNEFLDELRIVPIQGVSETVMSHMIDELLEIEGVDDVLYHKHTASKGRWNILTAVEHFRPVSAHLAAIFPGLASLYEDVLSSPMWLGILEQTDPSHFFCTDYFSTNLVQSLFYQRQEIYKPCGKRIKCLHCSNCKSIKPTNHFNSSIPYPYPKRKT